MQLGGNNGLGEFLSSYDLMSEPMDVRYQTKAAEYYRKKLKAFANDLEFTEEKPDYEEGRNPIEYRVKSAEELKEAIGGGKDKSGSLDANEIWEKTKLTTMKGVTYAGEGLNKLGTKFKESGVGDKLSSGAKTVGTKTVEYGGIAYSKTKEGINKIVTNEKVQEYSKKTYDGAKAAGKSVWGFFTSTYDKIANNKKDDDHESAPSGAHGGNSSDEPHVQDDS